jgi:hypothetical protein
LTHLLLISRLGHAGRTDIDFPIVRAAEAA